PLRAAASSSATHRLPQQATGAPLPPTSRPPYWVSVASMPTRGTNLAAAAGADSRRHLRTAEAPLATGPPFWLPVASMHTPRAGLAAVMGPDGHIYAIGGENFNATSQAWALATVEAYSLRTRTWTPVRAMSAPRDGLAAATGPDGRIYAIGGYDG